MVATRCARLRRACDRHGAAPAQWQGELQTAQLPAQPPGWTLEALRRNVYRALCQEPAASVPRAPATLTITNTRAVCGEAARATTPPAASITAAANWVGPIARTATLVASAVRVCDSDQAPNPAVDNAAHTHSTPVINMASQYEATSGSARRAAPGLSPRD